MFIIFSLLLWYCRNKLVLWLVSSWDDMRGEKKWMLAEVAPRCMPGLAAMQGLMASQLWVPRADQPFSAQTGHGESLEARAPLLTLFLALSMQLVAEDHLSCCALPTAAGVCHRNTVWGGGRGSYLQLICLLVSEVFGGAVGSKTQRLHLSENLSFPPEHQGDVVSSCQLSPASTAWTRPDSASISPSEIPLQGHGLSKFPWTGIRWRTRGACEGSICNRSTVTILALPFQSENNLF